MVTALALAYLPLALVFKPYFSWWVILVPLLLVALVYVVLMYLKDAQTIAPGPLDLSNNQTPVVLVPTKQWDKLTEKALRFAMWMSHDLIAACVRDRRITAWVLAHIAEFDSRELYLEAGYKSMHAYCVRELRLSEDAAYKRIQVARAAREFPVLFECVADGRLHLTVIVRLAPYLRPENAAELLAAQTRQDIAAVGLSLQQSVSGRRWRVSWGKPRLGASASTPE